MPSPPAQLLRNASLFLDFDGTLTPIAARPQDVVVTDALRALMARLRERLDGRVMIVSGRPLDEIEGLLGDAAMRLGGSHGLEWRDGSGRRSAIEPPAALADIIAAMEELASCRPGLLVERKPFGAALHYRQAPDAEGESVTLAERLAAETGLAIQHGKAVVELRVGGADKGTAVTAIMADPTLAGTTPIFIGDDVTDESAFRAVTAQGGAGILVGAPRDTAATYRLDDVDATLAWLASAAEELA